MNHGRIITADTRQQVGLNDKERVVVQVSKTMGYKQFISLYIEDGRVNCTYFDDENDRQTEVFHGMLHDGYASLKVNEDWNA